MTATQEQFGSVKEDIRILSCMVSQIQETVTDHSYRLSLIRTRQENLDMRFNKVERRLDKVEGRLDGIDGRLDGIDGRLNGIDGRLDGIDGRLDGLQGSVSEILTLVRKSQW